MRLKIFALTAFLLFWSAAFSQDTKENADFKLAINLYNDKLYDLALEQLQQFISRYPNSQQTVEAKFHLGLTQVKLGYHDDARFTFQNFALSYPDNPRAPEAWWNVAEAYVAQNDFREAAVSFERIKVFHPKSKLAAPGLLKASEYFGVLDDKANSERMLRTLLRDYPAADEATPARMRLADLSVLTGQYDVARAEIQRVINATKDVEVKARAQLVLVKALLGLSLLPDAEKILDEVIKNPRLTVYYDALFTKGEIKQQSGNRDEAVTSWQKITEDSLRAPAQLRRLALFNIGKSYSAIGSYGRALPYFERANELSAGESSSVLYAAAVAAEKSNQLQKAGRYYTQALRLGQADGNRKALLVGAFKGATFLQNYPDVQRLAGQYRTEFPEDGLTPRILFEAANVARLQMKDLQTASQLYRDVVTAYPSSEIADDALFGLGAALAQAGSADEALQAFENVEQRFPSSDLLSKAREEAQRLRLFSLKSRESGVEKLALLIGDVIAQKSKGDLSFRLAEIYFHDLKDYNQAAGHYAVALEADLEASKRPAARYALARAHEIMAWQIGLDKQDNSVEVSEALKNYELLLRAFPLNEFRDEAVASLFTLRLQRAASLTELRTLHDDFAREYPALEGRENVLLSFGDAYRKLEGDEEAIATYRVILQSRNSPETPEAMFQLAQVLRETGKVDSAYGLLGDYVTGYSEHLHSAEAAWMLGQEAMKRGDIQRSLRVYTLIEQKYPYTSFARRARLARAEAYFAANDLPNALENYQRYIAEVESDFYALPELTSTTLYHLAQCYQRTGRRAEAKRYYTSALGRNPDAAESGAIYFELASIAREERNLELAARYLQQASRVSGSNSDQRLRAALEAGDLLFRGEVYSEAVARYNDLLKEATTDSLKQYAQARIAVSYFRMNNAEQANSSVANFVKAYPKARNEAAEFEFERGRYLLRRDAFDRAKVAFENLIQKYEDTPIAIDAQYWLGRVVEATGRTQDALKAYETIIDKYPAHAITPRARLSLGNIYYNAEQWEPAVQQYRTILQNEEAAPDLVSFAMNNLILAYKELSLYDGALELTRTFIDRFPNDPSLPGKRIDMGVLYQKLGYYDQSVLHLQGLLENADPDTEAELRYYIGEAYYYKGDYQQAILEFLKVPYLVTRRTRIDWVATSYYMAGQSYEKMSRFDQAISMYQQILERPNIDSQFRAAAQKEIDRVNALVRSQR